jgi:hypothetical protein
MEDAQAFLGQPGVGFLSMLLIGVIAGWVAEKVTASDLAFSPICWSALPAPSSACVRFYAYVGGRHHRRDSDSVLVAGIQSGVTCQTEMKRVGLGACFGGELSGSPRGEAHALG